MIDKESMSNELANLMLPALVGRFAEPKDLATEHDAKEFGRRMRRAAKAMALGMVEERIGSEPRKDNAA